MGLLALLLQGALAAQVFRALAAIADALVGALVHVVLHTTAITSTFDLLLPKAR